MKLLKLKYNMHKFVNLIFYLIIFGIGFILGFSAEKINFNKLISQFLFIDNVSAQENLTCRESKNLLNPSVVFSDSRYYLVNDDLSVNIIGFDGSNINEKSGIKLPVGTYTLSCFDRNGAYLQVYNKTLDEPILDRQQDVNVFTLTKESVVVIKVYHEDLSVFPFKIHIMLEQGSTASTYEPFGQEICTDINNKDSFYEFAQKIFGEVGEENKFIYDFITFGLVVTCFILFVLIVGYIFNKFFGG